MPPPYDYAVIGAGLIGLATARALLLRGHARVAVLEAESSVAAHQSGRNSGVVHAGIYYPPRSLKARLCLQGMQASYRYFTDNGIPHRRVGKLIVALTPSQLPQLHRLHRNALTNGVPDVALLHGRRAIRAIEPECAGVAALHSPHTGIVDWGLVASHFADDIVRLRGSIHLNSRVTSLHAEDPHHITLRVSHATTPAIHARRVISCAGLQSDRVARLLGGSRHPAIVPVRGEYLRVRDAGIAARIRGNIYPLPAAGGDVPFLGVHFTRTMRDEVLVGPNAVLALARHGYAGTDVSARDVWEMAVNPGFWRLCVRYARFGVGEAYRSAFVSAAAAAAREYVPALRAQDFERAGRVGVRAQAVGRDGALVDDFVFEDAADGRVLHTRNAPSPGATSALAIAEMIVERSGRGKAA